MQPLILLLGIVAIHPLLKPTLPWSADGLVHLYRLVELDHCIRNGSFFPRWAPDLVYGYGLPLFNFYAPLSYYLAETLHLTGLSFPASIIATFAISILFAGLTIYLFVRDLFGEGAALVASVAYMYSPYLLYDSIFRGAMAETLAISLLPLILWAFRRLIITGKRLYLAISTLSFAALLLTHNATSLLFTPFLVVYIGYTWLTISKPKIEPLLSAAIALLLAFGIGSFFWLPALFEKNWVRIYQIFLPSVFDYRYNFLPLSEIFSLPIPVDTSLMNPFIPRSMGLVQLVLALFALLGARRFKDRGAKLHVYFFSFSLACFLFLISPSSSPIWGSLPLLKYVQFPWRFLGPASLSAAILAGASTRLLSKNNLASYIAILLSQTLLVAFSFTWLYPAYYPQMENLSPADIIKYERESGAVGTTSAGEYIPIWVEELPPESKLEGMYISGGTVERLEKSSLPEGAEVKSACYGLNSADLTISSPKPFRAIFNTFYFPGWKAYINGREVEITPTKPHGLISFEVKAGESIVRLRFEDTPLRTLGSIISALSLLSLLALITLPMVRRVGSSLPLSDRRLSGWQWSMQIILVIALFSIKTGYLDRKETWLRRSRFDGVKLEGIQVPLQVNFDDEMTLLGYEIRPSPVRSGEMLHLDLYWRARRKLREDYSIFVYLLDSQLNLYGQKDSQHPGGYPTSRWNPEKYAKDTHKVLVLPGTPPGEYELRVGVYFQDTLEKLNVLNEHGIPIGNSIVIRGVRVVRPKSQPQVEDLNIKRYFFRKLGGQLELLGFDSAPKTVKPGEEVYSTFFWRALDEMGERFFSIVELVGEEGDMRILDSFPVGGDYHPTTNWEAGELLRQRRRFLIPAEVSEGVYKLFLSVIDEDKVPLDEPVLLGEIEIESLKRLMMVPTIQNPMRLSLGGFVTFLGYDLEEREVRPGDSLRLVLYWRAEGEMERSYKVFTHLLDERGRIWAQKDNIPCNWTRPTTGWVEGEVISDVYELIVEEGAPFGEYVLEVGMYEEATGERLMVFDDEGKFVGDRILLGKVEVGSIKTP